jgi:hypothetical protein
VVKAGFNAILPLCGIITGKPAQTLSVVKFIERKRHGMKEVVLCK